MEAMSFRLERILSAKGGEIFMLDKEDKEKRGQVGIGTMIVFIAMVLVAAVAAGVLVRTSGFLQQKAMSTGQDTTEEVATGVLVGGVDAKTNGTSSDSVVEKIAITLSPNTGGTSVDLNQTVVELSDGDTSALLRYNSDKFTDLTDDSVNGSIFNSSNVGAWNGTSATDYTLLVVRDPDGSLTETAPTLNNGDTIKILVQTSAVFSDDMGLPVREEVVGSVKPEVGSAGVIDFTTPSSYTSEVIQLQ